MQVVSWCNHLWLTTVASVLLPGSRGCYAGQPTDTSGLVLAPLQIYGKSRHTVQWMLGVGSLQFQDCLLVTLPEDGVLFVEGCPTNANGLAEAPLETWFDLIQCG